jgi:3-oxoacyl-[acyl-carrier protein] reductase
MDAGARYQDRVAVVTGARRGIGRLVAEHLLAAGAQVVGLSRGADAVIEHPFYRHLPADVADDGAVRAAFREVGRRHGRLDLLVNAAAVLTSQYLLLLPGGRAEEMVRTNLLGPVLTCREAAKLMTRARYGRIVNVSSMAAVLEPPGDSVYAATKAALATFGAVLAKELGRSGITVNTLGVTAYPTDMLASLPADRVTAVIASLPVPRAATREDLLNALDFLLSERSGYVTAQTLHLGGVHA